MKRMKLNILYKKRFYYHFYIKKISIKNFILSFCKHVNK